jgi:hypothetical protein
LLTLEGRTIRVETRTLSAVIEDGFVMSFAQPGQAPLIAPFDRVGQSSLQLIYANGDTVDLVNAKYGTITTLVLSETCVEVRFQAWDAEGLLVFSECPETGALLVEPSAFSLRPGVLGCRWNLFGISKDLDLIAPIHQGIRLKWDDPLIANSHWDWPHAWEAGFAVAQGKGEGFWVHTRDDRYRQKALQVHGNGGLGFETHVHGPLTDNLAAGGLVWRLNAYEGDWQVPAQEYKDWLWQAYDLRKRRDSRADWIYDVALAINWSRADLEMLDALAEQVDPRRVLIHFTEWRKFGYDENYPDFTPSDAGKAFVAKGRAMGFHIMPHCNSIDIDPTHPVYQRLRDFQYRDVRTRGLNGWAWDGSWLGVPHSPTNLMGNRDKKVMVKIHPALSAWRSHLAEEVEKAMDTLANDFVFLDVTLCTWNLHNSLVENMSATEGMLKLIDKVAVLRGGLAVGGEGRNEITMQGCSFAQAHLFRSFQWSVEGLERTGGTPVCGFLFDDLCRTTGYAHLSGRDAMSELRIETHLTLGAIPTLDGMSAEALRDPTPAVRRVLERARA